jgi:DNA repair exonuclease SbcCD nuclease subunit
LLESPAKEEREDLLGIGDDRYLGLKEGFSLDETSMLVDGAIQILRERSQEVAVVIMGHTHEPVMRPEGLPYFNTGSWTRYYRFGEDDDPRPWSILQKGLYRDFPYQLLYAEIDPRNPSATVVKTYRTRNS